MYMICQTICIEFIQQKKGEKSKIDSEHIKDNQIEIREITKRGNTVQEITRTVFTRNKSQNTSKKHKQTKIKIVRVN